MVLRQSSMALLLFKSGTLGNLDVVVAFEGVVRFLCCSLQL